VDHSTWVVFCAGARWPPCTCWRRCCSQRRRLAAAVRLVACRAAHRVSWARGPEPCTTRQQVRRDRAATHPSATPLHTRQCLPSPLATLCSVPPSCLPLPVVLAPQQLPWNLDRRFFTALKSDDDDGAAEGRACPAGLAAARSCPVTLGVHNHSDVAPDGTVCPSRSDRDSKFSLSFVSYTMLNLTQVLTVCSQLQRIRRRARVRIRRLPLPARVGGAGGGSAAVWRGVLRQ
jgi:hypothetical protein